MRTNDEATSIHIKKELAKRRIVVNEHYGAKQGWTLQRTHYCQLIRVANKVKRLEYAQQILDSGDTFHNVITLWLMLSLAGTIQTYMLLKGRRAIEKKNRSLNIHLKYTYGQESAERELTKYPYSMV